MKRKVVHTLIIAFLLIDVVIIGFVLNKMYNKPEKAHFHAGIQVYVDGKLQDFSDEKYMNTTPCALKGESNEHESPEEIQIEKAHLHDNIGNVAHAHLTGGKWKDLFQNMKYDIESKGVLTGYINGKPADNILDTKINPYDSVIILAGTVPNETEPLLKKAVSRDEIVKAEKMSENCGSN